MIIDTPEGINACRLLAVRGALRLEILGLCGRASAAGAARRELVAAGVAKPPRSRKALLVAFEALLRERGILSGGAS